MRSASKFLAMFVVTAALSLWGCISEETWFRHQVSWGYVLDMEDAQRITDWTLQQHDQEKITDGFAALTSILGRWSRPQQEKAAEGILKMYRRALNGDWRDLATTSGDYRRTVLETMRRLIGFRKQELPDNPIAIKLWNELKTADPDIEPYGRKPEDHLFHR